MVDGVIKYHRTFSEIINSLTTHGFVIEKTLEPTPDDETLARLPRFLNEIHKPSYFLVRAKKVSI